MKHQLKVVDFEHVEFAHLLASASGQGQNKRLYVVVKDEKVSYRVVDHDTTVQTQTLTDAVMLYNQLGEA